MLQPMVLSLSLEALVDRRTVQQVCQQAQLRKLVAASYGGDGRLRLESVSLYSMGELLGKVRVRVRVRV